MRDAQTRLTRARILAAAHDGFVAAGYPAATITGIAAAAGVSAQTVYNTFGTKAGLFKAVYDVRLAGDDEPVAMGERVEFQALQDITDPRELLLSYARLGSRLLDRLGPVLVMLAEGAASGEPDLVDLAGVTGRERLIGARELVAQLTGLSPLRPGVTADAAADVVWTLDSYEVWDLLVRQRGWGADRYVTFVGRAMADALLPPETSESQHAKAR